MAIALSGSLALSACSVEQSPTPTPSKGPTCEVNQAESDKMLIGDKGQDVIDCPGVSMAVLQSVIRNKKFIFVPGKGDCHITSGTSPGTSKGIHYFTTVCVKREII
jgi:hypothetical protein